MIQVKVRVKVPTYKLSINLNRIESKKVSKYIFAIAHIKRF